MDLNHCTFHGYIRLKYKSNDHRGESNDHWDEIPSGMAVRLTNRGEESRSEDDYDCVEVRREKLEIQ